MPVKQISEIYNALKSYASGYLSASYTSGSITAGTPLLLDMSNFVIVNSNNFEISSQGITYTGTPTISIQGTFSLSISASVNNTIMKLYTGKNGTVNTNTEIDRKIGTGGDLGAATLNIGGQLSTGDTINIFADSTLNGTVTVRACVFVLNNTTL